jgi:lysine 2,3-aminomutase
MDVAHGLEHLRTPIATGVEILQGLRGWTSGLAVPQLAVDLPGGGGKVTLQPDYVLQRSATQTVLRNYRGEAYAYPEPREKDCSVPYDEIYYSAAAAPARRLPILPRNSG